jgi:hypothetical protein
MHRKLAPLALAVALAAGIASPGRAYAHDQTGLGLGANVTFGGISGLALNYWVTPGLSLEFMLAMGMNFPRPDMTVVDFNLGASAGIFGTLVGNETTNLMLGGRVAVLGQVNTTNMPDVSDDLVSIELDVPLRVEHWLDPQFSISAQVGFVVVMRPDISDVHPMTSASSGLGATSGLFGGAGFTFYFDAAQPAPPAAAPVSSGGGGGAAPPPPATGSDAPSWE